MCSLLLIPPVTTRSPHLIYTLFKGPEGGMVVMDYQDVMVEMELQGDKEKREILVCRDQLAHKVCTLHLTCTYIMSSDAIDDYCVWKLDCRTGNQYYVPS